MASQLDDKPKEQVLVIGNGNDKSRVSSLVNILSQNGQYKIISVDNEVAVRKVMIEGHVGVVLIDHYEDFDKRNISISRWIKNIFPYVSIIPLVKDEKDTKYFQNFCCSILPEKMCVDEVMGAIELGFQDRFININHDFKSGKPNLWIIDGPHRTAKTSIVNLITRILPYTFKPIRDTSRPERNGETPGKDHYFRTKEYMLANQDKYSIFYPHRDYFVGVEAGIIERNLAEKKEVLLIIGDVNASPIVTAKYPYAKKILVLSPLEDLIIRERYRRGDASDNKRIMEEYADYVKKRHDYDVIIDNPSYPNDYQPNFIPKDRDIAAKARNITYAIEHERRKECQYSRAALASTRSRIISRI